MLKDLVFIDCETGGLDPQKDALLSVGLVRWLDGEITGSTEILVQPEGLRVQPEALRVNKIDIARHRREAISRREASEKVWRWVQSNVPWWREGKDRLVIAGHNVAFDVGFTRRLFNDYWSRMVLPRTVDTSAILRFCFDAGLLPQEFGSLDQALAYFGITIDSAKRHTALGDAAGTAALYGALVRLARPGDLVSLGL